ncbi:MAG: glycerol-3-phosphate 1-O-acyltransferase PlsY [Proteobacteria bacterium]|nr:glycerol-3-phosphate 1-O-acyltransferase PlsY [Pseudomonadota bacterium]
MPDLLGDFSHTWQFWVIGAVGYLLGSIPFGLLISRLAGQGDIRKIGSGNIGATNVLRTGRKDLAALTLVLDMGKGALAAILGMRYGPDAMVFAASGAMLGHIAPIWLKGRGGKGVATAFGVLIPIAWQVAAACAAIWLIVAVVTRYSSLAALIAFVAAPGLAKLFADQQVAEFGLFLAVVIMVKHIPNLGRIIKGQESRIGEAEKAPPEAPAKPSAQPPRSHDA